MTDEDALRMSARLLSAMARRGIIRSAAMEILAEASAPEPGPGIMAADAERPVKRCLWCGTEGAHECDRPTVENPRSIFARAAARRERERR